MKSKPQHDSDLSHPRRRWSGDLSSGRHLQVPIVTAVGRRLAFCIAISICVIGLPVVTQSSASAAGGPTPLVTQIADEPVSVSAAAFRRHLFVAADAARLSDPSNTADLLAERVLQHMYALNAQTDPAAAAEAVQELLDAATSVTGPAFDSRISSTMVLFQQAAAADQGPVAATLQRATTEVVALTAHQISSVAASTHAENALGTTGDTESRLLASPTFSPTAVLLDSATLADDNTFFASARDRVWGSTTGSSISATSADLLANAPSLKDNADVQALAALRDKAGNLSTTGGVIAGTPTDPAPHTIGAAMADLDVALDTTRQAAEDGSGSTAIAAAAVEDARASQTTLALQTGFLTGGTSGAKDIVDQVGLSAIQVTLLAMSFNDFTAGTIGRAALSGNVLGVVMTLLPGVLEAAGVFGPSTEDLMATQLDNISQQMADFQNAVEGQFAQVFQTLSTVSDQLNDISQKLDRAVIDIEQARVQIGQIYDSLSRLQGSLDAVQNNILEALRNGSNSQLRQIIDSTLGYAERNGTPLPLGDFNNAAAFLHTFATVTARHSPELNTDYPSFDVQNDANQLSTGIASNVDFLDQVPTKRGWRTARLSRTTGDAPQLANMDDFVLASRAYAQLMLENTRYVTAGYRRWLSDIQQLGTPLAALTSAISTSDSRDFTHSTLLNQVVCAHTSAAFAPTLLAPCQPESEDTPAVDTVLAQATTQLMGTLPGYDGTTATPLSPLTVEGSTTFNPFVNTSSDQSDLSGLWKNLPGRNQVAQCGTAANEIANPLGAMARPASLTPDSQGVPQAFQWADRMGLGTLNVCYKTRVVTAQVEACRFGDDGDGWLAVNVRISFSDLCPNVYWLRGGTKSSLRGVPTTASYKYDDTAFVWTYTPSDAPSAPIYVQSVVRRGAATAEPSPSTRVRFLPNGGYAQDFPEQYSDNASYHTQPGPDGIKVLDTDGLRAPFYQPLDTIDKVSGAWGDATTADPSIRSYQNGMGAIQPGDVWDQAIAGLDPKLSTDAIKYARTCTAADQASSSSLCETGAGGTSIVSLAKATQSVVDATDAKLVVQQGNIYRGLLSGTQTAGNMTSGPLRDALVRLDGANAMLGSYLQLGASAALRQRDLTGLPGDLTGSKALTAAIKTELAKTSAGKTGTAPSRLVTDTLDFRISDIEGLDGLLPRPAASGRAAAGSSQSIAGPVNPAIQSTNDQLTLTAIALGAPASATTTPTTPTTPTSTPTPAPTMGPVVSPSPTVHVAFTNAWVSAARVNKRFKARVTATGGTAAFSWARHGKLPRGLRGSPTRTGRAYVIEGTPKKRGVFTFTLTATEAGGASSTIRYKIRVR